MQTPQGPPYAPQIWQLGGAPDKSVDVPVSAVLLAMFIGAAAIHMTILQKNNKRGHKFLFSGVMFGRSCFLVLFGFEGFYTHLGYLERDIH
jgi:hypothetical protein